MTDQNGGWKTQVGLQQPTVVLRGINDV